MGSAYFEFGCRYFVVVPGFELGRTRSDEPVVYKCKRIREVFVRRLLFTLQRLQQTARRPEQPQVVHQQYEVLRIISPPLGIATTFSNFQLLDPFEELVHEILSSRTGSGGVAR